MARRRKSISQKPEDRDEAFVALRRAETTGRPVGTAEFVTGLERVLGDLLRGVRGFKPELDAEQSGPVISGTWLPK
jgi:hypothetical protein